MWALWLIVVEREAAGIRFCTVPYASGSERSASLFLVVAANRSECIVTAKKECSVQAVAYVAQVTLYLYKCPKESPADTPSHTRLHVNGWSW